MTCSLRLAPLALLLAFAGSAPAQEINWRADYGKALAEAGQTGRPLFINVGSENCYWCRQLDIRPFKDAGLVEMINTRCIPLKVDGTKNAYLSKALRIQSYPTLVFAAPDGTIVSYKEGFQETDALKQQVLKVLTAVGAPDWMSRDYDLAAKAAGSSDYARAMTLLRTVVEDGKDRPIQQKARTLLADIEKKATAEAELAEQLASKGRKQDAVAAYQRINRDFPGTTAARQGRQAMMRLASRADADNEDRPRQAAELLAQAKQDYRSQRFLICLDRCEMLAEDYTDLPEAKEAAKLAEQIKDNPEWTRNACDQMGERLSILYLALADSWLKKGQPQQAIFYLERVTKLFPGSRQAEQAQARLARLQGAPEKR